MGAASSGNTPSLHLVARWLCIFINVGWSGVRVFLPVSGLAMGLVCRSFFPRLAIWSSLGNRCSWRGRCQWSDDLECSHERLPQSAYIQGIYRQFCKYLGTNDPSRKAGSLDCLAIVGVVMRGSAGNHRAVLSGDYCHAGAQQEPE